MPSAKVMKAVREVGIVIVGVIAIWGGLRVAFATDNPFFVVSSGSMEPVLNIHDVLIVRGGSTFDEVQSGDIIVFNRPQTHDRVIVHRIVAISDSSERILTTKGDANPASIPGTDYPITGDDYIGKVIYVIPKIGYVTKLINPPINYIIIAIILALLFFNRSGRKPKQDTSTPPPDSSSPPSDGSTPPSDGSTPPSDGSTSPPSDNPPPSEGKTPPPNSA